MSLVSSNDQREVFFSGLIIICLTSFFQRSLGLISCTVAFKEFISLAIIAMNMKKYTV